jgi:hypothetical protein
MTEHIYGPNGHIVDAFIEHLKGMTEEQWDAARDAAGDAAWDAAGDAAWDAAGDAAWEIQGADLLHERNQPFFFLPLFGFADEQAVLGDKK